MIADDLLHAECSSLDTRKNDQHPLGFRHEEVISTCCMQNAIVGIIEEGLYLLVAWYEGLDMNPAACRMQRQ